MLYRPHAFSHAAELDVYDATRSNAVSTTANLLSGLRGQVIGAYTQYADSACATDLSPLFNTEGDEARALRSNYPKLRSGVEKERGAAVLRRSKKCCLCGVAPVAQLDHHLPKEVFPEFSVLTFNLVPVCGDCNFKKRTVYRRGDGGPAFLHAYRDPLPATQQYLDVQINLWPDTVVASFHVVQTPGMDNSTFATLKHHFEALGLADIYGDLAAELLAETLTPLYEYYDEDEAVSVEKYLRRDARGASRKHGINYWKSALLNALADCDAFCEGGFMVLGDRDELPLESV